MTRLTDWRPRLNAYIETQRRGAFAYGSRDCALLVAGAVEAMTGVDHAAGFRGAYATLEAGLRRVRRAGWIDHVDMVASLFEEVRPATLAQIGDIAVIEEDVLGIVGGPRIFAFQESGMVTVDLLAIRRAFRV